MRRVLFAVLMLVQCVCFAQKSVKPIRIEMTDAKYLFVKFPSEINYADMGSSDILAEKFQGGILKLKAEKSNFDKTNLSVVTSDGKYYSFIVEYRQKPPFIAVDMGNVTDSITATDIIPSTDIEVSDIHTTHIILPSKVADIAIGNEEVISEKAEEIDNIVKVKSVLDKADKFVETSITVVTNNGSVFPMNVGYAKNPKEVSVSFSDGGNALFNNVNADDANMRKISEWIIGRGQHINNLGVSDNKMVFQLCGVFTNQDVVAFYLYAKNSSKIDYPIDFIKTYIADKKVGRNALTQDEELVPIYSYYGNPGKIIRGKEGMSIVLFFRKFTIPKDRIVFFELYEDNGGRNLKFTAPNKVLINAEVMGNLD